MRLKTLKTLTAAAAALALTTGVTAKSPDPQPVERDYTGVWYHGTAGTEPQLALFEYTNRQIIAHWVTEANGTMRGYGLVKLNGSVLIQMYSDTSGQHWGEVLLQFDKQGHLWLEASSVDGAEMAYPMLDLVHAPLTCKTPHQ